MFMIETESNISSSKEGRKVALKYRNKWLVAPENVIN